MKESFLLQILKGKSLLNSKSESKEMAAKLGYKMYVFNGIVYSIYSDDELFDLKDLVDYEWLK